jgi:hypothetical protein
MSRKSRIANLILLIFSIDLFVGLALVISNLFVDYQELYSHLSFANVLDFEVAETIVLTVMEAGLGVGLYLYLRMINSQQYYRENILKLIAGGENEKVEFKQTLRWDIKEKRVNKALEGVILKTVVGFLNTDGGTLIIGVSDERKIEGLKKDYISLPKKSCDGMENHLSQLLISACGLEARNRVAIGFAEFDGKEVCVVEVGVHDRPVYLRDAGEEFFFVRVGNGTRPLSISKATEYIETHFRK